MAICVKWLGHAAFQIRASANVIYIDLKKYGKVIETSEKADTMLVTHNHGDRCSPPKIQKLRKANTIVIATKDCAKRIGGKVRTLKPEEETTIGDITIKAVEAYNVINPKIAIAMHT